MWDPCRSYPPLRPKSLIKLTIVAAGRNGPHHREWFIRNQRVESLGIHTTSRRIRFLPEVRVFMAFKTPNYCRDALLLRHGTNRTLWKPQRVIYQAPALRITTGASPEQSNTFAGSEVMYGIQNARLLRALKAINTLTSGKKEYPLNQGVYP